MIDVQDGYFRLTGRETAMVLHVNESGRLEMVHYGGPVALSDAPFLRFHPLLTYGTELEDDQGNFPDHEPLVWSGLGRGDFREPPLEVRFSDSAFTNEFLYDSHEILEGACPMKGLPSGRGEGAQSLVIHMKEAARPLDLDLVFTLFPDEDVIGRRVRLINRGEEAVVLDKVMSTMMDLPGRDYGLLNLTGTWNREAHPVFRKLDVGRTVQASLTGASSNRVNPAFALYENGAGEDRGRVYGFNLIYSGNHYASVEESPHHFYRVQAGINPEGFSWTLRAGETFESPQAVMTTTDRGFGGMSDHFHRFINKRIISEAWQDRDRPIAINSWEAMGPRVSERSLLKLAKEGRDLGMELLVLDDGWFQGRGSDTAGLGDYSEDAKKLPGGLDRLARKVRDLGMDFGLWVEPESVNPDSDLYRAHPDYAIQSPDRTPILGRHQLLLDLTRTEVEDYVVDQVNGLLDRLPISYIKWDMNRHMADFFSPTCPAGELAHRYILSLYRILDRIFGTHPQVLLEMCSSGGNRFDLGMLAYAPQIWASDDTDPVERLTIQKGLSYFYPQSTISCHVSAAPHSQTLRQTPLPTRFNVAAMGVLGYELDLSRLSPVDKKAIQAQTAFYKDHRSLLQRGTFHRRDDLSDHQEGFAILSPDRREGVVLMAQRHLDHAGPAYDRLKVSQLDPDLSYMVRSRPQKCQLACFGHLLNYVLPPYLKGDSLPVAIAGRHMALDEGEFEGQMTGRALREGIFLPDQFKGSGYDKKLRLWGDYGAQLYTIQALPEGEGEVEGESNDNE